MEVAPSRVRELKLHKENENELTKRRTLTGA